MGPRAGLDTVSKKKIPGPRRDSNPDHPIVQPVVRNWGRLEIHTKFCWKSMKRIRLVRYKRRWEGRIRADLRE
jgi:hypothetical protein